MIQNNNQVILAKKDFVIITETEIIKVNAGSILKTDIFKLYTEDIPENKNIKQGGNENDLLRN